MCEPRDDLPADEDLLPEDVERLRVLADELLAWLLPEDLAADVGLEALPVWLPAEWVVCEAEDLPLPEDLSVE